MGILQGRHIAVTGAGRGIGAAIAQQLAAQGARLSLMGRRREALQELARSLPGDGHAVLPLDVTDAQAVTQVFDQAREQLGPLYGLINNAGQAESAPLLKTSLDLWRRMLDVNLTGCFLCTQAALPDMLAARSGRVVHVASTAGQRGYAYVSAYVAAKHGVVGLTRALALEVASQGVTVNAVCPGYTDTDLLRDSVARVVAKTGRSEEEALAAFARSNPQGRLVQPAQVADAVAWLCSPGADAITGQCVSVSGGEVM